MNPANCSHSCQVLRSRPGVPSRTAIVHEGFVGYVMNLSERYHFPEVLQRLFSVIRTNLQKAG